MLKILTNWVRELEMWEELQVISTCSRLEDREQDLDGFVICVLALFCLLLGYGMVVRALGNDKCLIS